MGVIYGEKHLTMVHSEDGRVFIDYPDFEDLLNQGGWALSVGMKDNWCVEEHLNYISGLVQTHADYSVRFTIDSESLRQAQKIDVYITPKQHDATPKHIQFIKTKVA